LTNCSLAQAKMTNRNAINENKVRLRLPVIWENFSLISLF
jgi:hypothetical protein